MPSANAATGWFRLEKFGKRWMLVDPDNNGFFLMGVEVVATDQSTDNLGGNYYARVKAKYGDNNVPNWGPSQVNRLRNWGFNTIAPYSSPYAWPHHYESVWPGDHYNPQKMPFINYSLRPSYYGMRNSDGYIAEPVKNFVFGINTAYDTNWLPPEGEADYYDSKLYSYLDGALAHDWQMTDLNNPSNPYLKWLIAVVTDEADQTFSFSTGPDFVTYPGTGRNHAHGGYRVAICSPLQTANRNKNAVYSDTTVYNKAAWHDYLLGKYATVSALNSAWGSSYTSFDSSGTAVTAEAVGSGNGSTFSFSKTLAQPTVSKFSLQVKLAGTVVGGDNGDGTLYGPHLSGTINYSSGALSLTFASGYAPASGAPLTVSYVQNGWGLGTGVMDEDGRHTSWMGSDSVYLSGANPNFKADVDQFLYQMAKYYFQTGKTHTLAHFNAVVPGWKPIYLGPNALNYWNVPPRAGVLRAAGEVLDALVVVGYPLPQAQLDFIYQNAGDKPLINLAYMTANADSAMWRYPDNAMAAAFPTQAARGQGYYNLLWDANTGLIPAAYSATGVHPYVGNWWWKYLDTVGEQANWGIVSLSDNAYDSHESVYTDAAYDRLVTCSAPLTVYLCGGEEKNYGDTITGMKNAHQQAITQLPNLQ